MQQFIDARSLTPRQDARIGAGALCVLESGDKEHQLGRFVARVGGAMTEMDARFAQRPRAALNGGAYAGRVAGLGVANGFRGCMG